MLATRRDSILAVGQRLVRVARAIDGYGREIGTTPETFRGPVIWGRTQDGRLLDLWGTGVRYRTAGERFELTSAGPDQSLDTADDIIVRAEIGSGVPCEFRTQWGDQRCAEPTPECQRSEAASGADGEFDTEDDPRSEGPSS